MNRKHFYKLIVLGMALVTLNACSSSRYDVDQDYGPSKPVDVSHVKNAVPREEPRSKYGNPETYEVRGKTYRVLKDSKGYSGQGIASWYGKKFHGHRTSSGETYNMYAMTAAHKTLPLPTYVRVTHLDNGKSVIVKVNDRGPFHEGRIIDLSYAAAHKLGVTASGTGRVKVTAIEPGTDQAISSTDNGFVNGKKKSGFKPRFNRATALQTTTVKSKYAVFLQLGAFSDKQNANKLTRRLARMFKSRKIQAEYLSEKNLYRVRIGPLASTEEANKISTMLQQKGIHSSPVVID